MKLRGEMKLSDERLKGLMELAKSGQAFIRTAQDAVVDGQRISPFAELDEILRELLELRERERWRRCSEEMPDEDTPVLCCQTHYVDCVWTDWWERFADGPDWASGQESLIPTHWRPLPSPPEEER